MADVVGITWAMWWARHGLCGGDNMDDVMGSINLTSRIKADDNTIPATDRK